MLSLILAIMVVSIFMVGKVFKEDSTVFLLRLWLIVVTMLIGFNVFKYSNAIATENYIDDKISLLQNHNDYIKMRLEDTVEAHTDYVKSTEGKSLEILDEMLAILVIPELRTDSRVQQQLEMYIQNEKVIRELEERKLEIQEYKWLLYFEK